jgi:DNA gyrase subunit B
VGASVVNALSEWLEVKVCDGSHCYFQRFERGKECEPLKVIGEAKATGTQITFKPDAEIFQETTVYDYEILLTRLREQAFLNAGVYILSSKTFAVQNRRKTICITRAVSAALWSISTSARGGNAA